MDGSIISIISGVFFALIILIYRIYKKGLKEFDIIKTAFFMIISYIAGLMIYPSILIIYYSITKGSTFFNEEILDYNTYLIISGFILLVCAIFSLVEFIKKT